MNISFKYSNLLSAIVLLLSACASLPKGGDVADDIKAYAYQNKPRVDGILPEGTLSFRTGKMGSTIASSDFPWRIPVECRREYRQWLETQETRVTNQIEGLGKIACPNKTPKNSFLAVAITGGGNKSEVYASEVLFELARYGLTRNMDAISSVSGGSFTALLYSLSCDPLDADCSNPPGWRRPRWEYDEVSRLVESNYFWPFVGRRYLPNHQYLNVTTFHNSADDMADIVSYRLLHQTDRDLTFADLNPQRPNLILNATNVSQSRPDIDMRTDIKEADRPLPPNDRRAISDDDALHFSFTQQYFWRLGSDLDSYPLKQALVASAAFPLIIDRPTLRQYDMSDIQFLMDPNHDPAITPHRPKYIALYDGGVQDNFGLTEYQWFLQCEYDVNSRHLILNPDLYWRECGRDHRDEDPPKGALVFNINSSLLRSEGVPGKRPDQRTWDSYVSPLRISGTLESVDMIMAASGEMRKMEFRSVLESLDPPACPRGGIPGRKCNPFDPRGLFQNVDLDIEAAEFLSCPGPIDRTGIYTGPALNETVVNSTNGASEASRCKELQGVLEWNAPKIPGRDHSGRNIDLPRTIPGLCDDGGEKCEQMDGLFGEVGDVKDEQDDPIKRFIGDDAKEAPGRLINNELLFQTVRQVPTDFRLSLRYVWLLRYTARWVVAHRVWQLCNEDRPLLELMGVAKSACDDPLPPRPRDDRVGGKLYQDADF
jgi:hypothetical protein